MNKRLHTNATCDSIVIAIGIPEQIESGARAKFDQCERLIVRLSGDESERRYDGSTPPHFVGLDAVCCHYLPNLLLVVEAEGWKWGYASCGGRGIGVRLR
jgi:hypothetical protein